MLCLRKKDSYREFCWLYYTCCKCAILNNVSFIDIKDIHKRTTVITVYTNAEIVWPYQVQLNIVCALDFNRRLISAFYSIKRIFQNAIGEYINLSNTWQKYCQRYTLFDIQSMLLICKILFLWRNYSQLLCVFYWNIVQFCEVATEIIQSTKWYFFQAFL